MERSSGIGVMAMPADFRYADVFEKGRPVHDRYDPFRIRHPRMSNGRRAKIFSPFDALKGFSDAVDRKNILYEEQRGLSPEAREELDRKLGILHGLTYNGRMARANRPEIRVTYYEACSDADHEACGLQGRYRTVAGICRKVDAEITKTIQIDEMRIPLADLREIEADSDLFSGPRGTL